MLNYFQFQIMQTTNWLFFIVQLFLKWSFRGSCTLQLEAEFLGWVWVRATANLHAGSSWPCFSVFVHMLFWREIQPQLSCKLSVVSNSNSTEKLYLTSFHSVRNKAKPRMPQAVRARLISEYDLVKSNGKSNYFVLKYSSVLMVLICISNTARLNSPV